MKELELAKRLLNEAEHIKNCNDGGRVYLAFAYPQDVRDLFIEAATALKQSATGERVDEPRPMETAPRDGTIVRLLVQFTDSGFEDVGPEKATWTIGQNGADHHPEDDKWLFSGWNWEQDCFTQGEGTPIGWLPMIDSQKSGEGEDNG